jgi:hypothetical protein
MFNLHIKRSLVKQFIKKQSENAPTVLLGRLFIEKRLNPNLHAPAAHHALFLRNVV